MPVVETQLLASSVFMYPTARDANEGSHYGGSGFLVAIPSEPESDRVHLYVISNAHVVHGGAPIPRLVDVDGTPRAVALTADDWVAHPDGDDIAMADLGLVPDRNYYYINVRSFLTSFELTRDALPYKVGPGDECLIIGRYINGAGRQFDQPVVRFGNLAMLPELVEQKSRGSFEQLSFLVDMRSQSGFSGSPVIVYYEAPGYHLPPHPDGLTGPDLTRWQVEQTRSLHEAQRPVINKYWLLGIDWGHLPVLGDIRRDGVLTGERVEVSSGMAAVVPAWKIRDLLDLEEFEMARKKSEEKLAEKNEGDAVLD